MFKAFSKRFFDIISSSIAILLLLPLLAVIGISLFMDDRSSIIYKSKRIGIGGRPFTIYKFRTMNEPLNGNGPRVTAKDDPRITRLGRFLRTTKLNELPQLFNVLKGNMSMVGPRPEDPEFVKHYSAIEKELLRVKPGITSPASIIYYDEERLLSFSNVVDAYIKDIMPRKLRLDLQYVRHQSILLDLDILLQTFISLIPKLTAAPEIEMILFGPVQKLIKKYVPWFVIDWVIGFIAVGLAGYIWRGRAPLNIGIVLSFFAALFLASIFSIVNWMMGLHSIVWKRASNADAVHVALSASIASALSIVANKWMWGHQIFPSGMILLGCFFALNGFIGMRYWRVVVAGLANPRIWRNGNNGKPQNVIIVGAGEMAAFLLRSLSSDQRGRKYHILGFVDDNPVHRGGMIRGVKVLGSTRRLPQLVKDFEASVLLVALQDFDVTEHQNILQTCAASGVRVVQVPDICSMIYAGMSGNAQPASKPTIIRKKQSLEAFVISRG